MHRSKTKTTKNQQRTDLTIIDDTFDADFDLPKFCINEKCPRKGIKIFANVYTCTKCKSELVTDLDFEDLGDLESEAATEFVLVKTIDHSTFTRTSGDVIGCPIAANPVIQLPLKLYNRCLFLADQVETEWIAYLIGSSVDDNTYLITDMYFPKQEASNVTCEALDGEILSGTIGAIHSHVDMEVFFSIEDMKHFNHPVELVINNKGELRANARKKLECGRWHRGEADVHFVDCDEELALQEELASKIKIVKNRFVAKSSFPGILNAKD